MRASPVPRHAPQGAGAAVWGRAWRGRPSNAPLRDVHTACPYPGAASCRHSLEDRLSLRLATQLQDLQRICPWRPFTSCRGLDRSGWTAAARTLACCHTPGGLGRWHTLTITTFTRGGQQRRTGGDVWSVRLVEAHSEAAMGTRVLDNGDGSYTVAFVPAVQGGRGGPAPGGTLLVVLPLQGSRQHAARAQQHAVCTTLAPHCDGLPALEAHPTRCLLCRRGVPCGGVAVLLRLPGLPRRAF